MRLVVSVKCWITAPTANARSEPSPGEPSPDQPVRGPSRLSIDVRSASVCGMPRMLKSFSRSSKPSWFSTISANSRISRGFSKLRARSGLVSATNSGSSAGSVAMNAGVRPKLSSGRWQVPQVRPLPSKVSVRKIRSPISTSVGGRGGGGCLQAASRTAIAAIPSSNRSRREVRRPALIIAVPFRVSGARPGNDAGLPSRC